MEKNIYLNKEDSVFINDKYEKKQFMSQYEQYFYKVIKNMSDKYIIIPQVNLATIINKKNKVFCTELFRNIDFGVFDNKFNIKLLIEINDKTHIQSKRIKRDINVRKICKDADIPLIVFYSKYKNSPKYIINRILDKLEEED